MKFQRVVAEVSTSNLKHNLKQLHKTALKVLKPLRGSVVMLKANAYGHGMVPVGKTLQDESEVLAFGVATLSEALLLRKSGIQKNIWVFSGHLPYTKEVHDFCYQNRVTPVLISIDDIKNILKFSGSKRVPFHLKLNTGMNRLGLDESEWFKAWDLIRKSKNHSQFEGLCTHFGKAADYSDRRTREQATEFNSGFELFQSLAPRYVHSANSATILGELLSQMGFCNVIRPGIALYGYPESKKDFGLKPVLKLRAKVILSRMHTKPGYCGYDFSYSFKKDEPQSVVAMGYADGFHRILSNGKILLYQGNKKLNAIVQGRVSMDIISVSAKAKVGDWITFLGHDHSQAHVLAEAAQTNVYEILTSLSSRVERIYK